jgi:quinolinate synthase
MAESADILTADDQVVILTDLAAGCSMADMGAAGPGRGRVGRHGGRRRAGQHRAGHLHELLADIKAFCGRNGGVVCTSSNADVALEWAFEQKPTPRSSSSPTSTSVATRQC